MVQEKIIFWAPMTSFFSSKTKNRQIVLQSIENITEQWQYLMPYTYPDFDRGLLNLI